MGFECVGSVIECTLHPGAGKSHDVDTMGPQEGIRGMVNAGIRALGLYCLLYTSPSPRDRG